MPMSPGCFRREGVVAVAAAAAATAAAGRAARRPAGRRPGRRAAGRRRDTHRQAGETEAAPHALHTGATQRARAGVRQDALPRHLHARGAGATHRPDRVARTGESRTGLVFCLFYFYFYFFFIFFLFQL